jgi:hypothetical protein
VLLLPKGIVPTLKKLIVDAWTLRRQKKTGGKADE